MQIDSNGGSMLLDDYLKKSPRGEAARLARALGCGESRIVEYRRGRRTPRLSRALEIEKLTGRQVRVADLIVKAEAVKG